MTDHRLNELLDDASRTFRVPREPDLEAMWSEIERESFDQKPRDGGLWWRAPSWRVLSVGMAATLVLGIGLGRLTMNAPAGGTMAAAVTPDTARASGMSGAYDRVASELLGRTAVLLTALPEARSRRADGQFTTQAVELLTSTRLLLDSPAASDARFKDLLEDLELVLAQIASLRTGRGQQDMQLITDALQDRDVVPRIRSAVARMSLGDG